MAALTPEKFKVIGYTEEDANRIDRPTISYWLNIVIKEH